MRCTQRTAAHIRIGSLLVTTVGLLGGCVNYAGYPVSDYSYGYPSRYYAYQPNYYGYSNSYRYYRPDYSNYYYNDGGGR
jgi:hypothetical protein